MSEVQLPKIHSTSGLVPAQNTNPEKPTKKGLAKTQKGKMADSKEPDLKIPAEEINLDVNSLTVDAIREYKMAETVAVLKAGVDMHNQMIRVTNKRVQKDQQEYRDGMRANIDEGLAEIGLTWEQVEEIFNGAAE